MGRYRHREILCEPWITFLFITASRHSYRHGWLVGRTQSSKVATLVLLFIYIEVLDTPNPELSIRIEALIQKAKDIITLFLHRQNISYPYSPNVRTLIIARPRVNYIPISNYVRYFAARQSSVACTSLVKIFPSTCMLSTMSTRVLHVVLELVRDGFYYLNRTKERVAVQLPLGLAREGNPGATHGQRES